MKKILSVIIAISILTVFAFSAQPRKRYLWERSVTIPSGGTYTSIAVEPEGDYVGVSLKVPYGSSVLVEIRNADFGRVLKRYMTDYRESYWQQEVYDNPPPKVDVRIKNDNDYPITLELAIFD